MLSYKNDPKLKQRFVKEIEKHRKADQILQGTYGKVDDKWRGCAVACSLRSLDIINGKDTQTEYDQHERYESELGIPEWLARLEDTIFEGLPQKEAMMWTTRFSKAVPVGVDLEPIKWKFCAYLMRENIDRVLKLNIPDELKEQVVSAIRGVLNVHEQAIKTGEWDESAAGSAAESAWSAAWSAAGSAAGSAAESAAESAWSARSAAWSAAGSAAESAWSARSAAGSAAESAWSARSAAWSAAESAGSAAGSAAWSATYTKHSKELLKLLKAEAVIKEEE